MLIVTISRTSRYFSLGFQVTNMYCMYSFTSVSVIFTASEIGDRTENADRNADHLSRANESLAFDCNIHVVLIFATSSIND